MVEGKTRTGFEFRLEDEALDDYELLETLQRIDEGEYQLTTAMVDMLLGKDQKEALKEHVRGDNGRVSAQRMLEEVMEIFETSNEGKN